jgi:hypothetical protein
MGILDNFEQYFNVKLNDIDMEEDIDKEDE